MKIIAAGAVFSGLKRPPSLTGIPSATVSLASGVTGPYQMILNGKFLLSTCTSP